MYNYLNYLLQEKRNYKERDKVSKKSQIMNFLKGWDYKPGHSSNVFVAFKTGDYETIIPPISLGGSKYTSPQGFYCFDMNALKDDLFGKDNPIEKRFIDVGSFYGRSDFGLGYANDGGLKIKDNKMYRQLPRYLYFIKIKSTKKIISRAFNPQDIYGPFLHFLKYYGNQLIDNETKIFSLKLKMTDEESKKLYGDIKFYDTSKKNLIVISDWFKANKDKYKNVEHISYFLRYPDAKDLYSNFYYLMLSLAQDISSDNQFIRVNLMFNACGVDGFTQWSDNKYIHSDPENQTLLLNDSCILEKIKIDRAQNDFSGDINTRQKEDWVKNNDIKDGDWVKRGTKYINFKTKQDPDHIKQKKSNQMNNLRKLSEREQLIADFVNNMKIGDIIKIDKPNRNEYDYDGNIKYIIKQKNDDFFFLLKDKKQNALSIKNELKVDGVEIGNKSDVYFQPQDFINKDINDDVLFDTTLFNDGSFRYYDEYKDELNMTIDEFTDKQKIHKFRNEEEIIKEILRGLNTEYPTSDKTLDELFDNTERKSPEDLMEILDTNKKIKKYYSNNSYKTPIWTESELYGVLKKNN